MDSNIRDFFCEGNVELWGVVLVLHLESREKYGKILTESCKKNTM